MSVVEKKGFEKEDIDDLKQEVLQEYDAGVMQSIQPGLFGSIVVDDDARHAPDGYYIVQWSGQPYTLQEDTEVDGAILPEGTLVCQAVYWNWVRGATRWFTPPTGEPEAFLFRLRYVVNPCVTMEDLSVTARLPNSWRPARKATVTAMGPKRVVEEAHDQIISEIARRALLHYEEDSDNDSGSDDEDNDEEDSVDSSDEAIDDDNGTDEQD